MKCDDFPCYINDIGSYCLSCWALVPNRTGFIMPVLKTILLEPLCNILDTC